MTFLDFILPFDGAVALASEFYVQQHAAVGRIKSLHAKRKKKKKLRRWPLAHFHHLNLLTRTSILHPKSNEKFQ